MTRPSVAEDPPWRSVRARSLRSKPSASIASTTRAAVAGATPASALMTRETVFKLTPAVCATSLMVGLDNVVTPRPDASRAVGPVSSHAGGELLHARGVELAGRRVLDARRGGRDPFARRGGEPLAALERRGERGRQHVA